jgi:predicted RNA-binding Zn-ribbon protein involved in translation (DUF1610 family)
MFCITCRFVAIETEEFADGCPSCGEEVDFRRLD